MTGSDLKTRDQPSLFDSGPQHYPAPLPCRLLTRAAGFMIETDCPLDAGIVRYAEILYAAGIETYESCEGGDGHCYPEPTVRFHGDKSEGFKALDVAMKHGLPVASLRRVWTMQDGEPVGPKWEMVFTSKDQT